jgi:glycosyltransferase 2 family protein
MDRFRQMIWPAIGLVAVVFGGLLLYRELKNLSVANVLDSLAAIPASGWALALAATLVAYIALGEYDRVALSHLRRKIPIAFVMVASFTTYALSHNIGASLLSGALIRFRAYGSRGLTAGEIGVLVGLTTFTFIFGALFLGGITLILRPDIVHGFFDIPGWASTAVGVILLAIVLFYLAGSLLHLRPLTIGGFHLYYPRPQIVLRQIAVGSMELMAAAAIIYFTLPAAGNPGYLTILGVFIISFSVALVSHAPGGLGVLEFVFVAALPEIDQAALLASLIVFRILYLILPLALALVVVLVFERAQYGRKGTPPAAASEL